jgi:DNA repair exonuclease SbcCD nuclease subunit
LALFLDYWLYDCVWRVDGIEYKQMKNVSAILCADLHIREDSPKCRLDDFMATQTRKLRWLKKLQEKYNVPILYAGDIFNYWKPSPYLLSYTFRELPDDIIAIPGQHDLPAHNLDNIDRSGIQVLSDSGKVTLLIGDDDYDNNGIMYQAFPWGVPITGMDRGFGESRAVAIIHYGAYENKPHYPGAENTGGTAKSIINKMPGFDLILSGDNHLTFTCNNNNRLLVNPGSFMRTTAAQADHKPCVFLWDAITNTIEQVFIPIEQGVISREHIDEVADVNDRLEAFVSRLDHDVELSIKYKVNMRNYLAKNRRRIAPEVVRLIWGSMP